LSVSQVAVLSGYDLDSNGVVNVADLVLAAAQFGGPGTADFNADGVVNILDLILVVKNFTV
jgi:Ca2+-binding EF-hand superfamily protein